MPSAMAAVKPLATTAGPTLLLMASDTDGRTLVAERLIRLAEQLAGELGNDTEAALRMGIGQSVLSKIKNGERKGSIKTVVAVSRAMKINPMFFFDDSTQDPKYRDYLLATSPPQPGDGVTSMTAMTDARVRASLVAYSSKHPLGEDRAAAERVDFGHVPDDTDWEMWRMQRERAKREGRAEKEGDIARTTRATQANAKRGAR